MTSPDDVRPAWPDGSHLDPDTIAVAALGEPMPADVAAHLDGCDRCRAQIDRLTPVVQQARSLETEDLALVLPPPVVWARIAAEARVGGSAAVESQAVTLAPDDDHGAAPGPRAVDAGPGTRAASPPAEVPPHRRRPTWLLAAAVVGAVLGASAVLGVRALLSDGDGGEPTVVAAATLDPLPTKQASGSAKVEDVPTGRELSVDVKAAAPQGSYLEVWLMSDPQHLISLGVLDHDSGTFPVPPGIDIETYKVVDVSVEPYDGDPAHSTDSIVRGTLQPS